jgi:hypothetical protein
VRGELTKPHAFLLSVLTVLLCRAVQRLGSAEGDLDLPHFRGRFRFRYFSFGVMRVQGYPRDLPVDSSLHHPVH